MCRPFVTVLIDTYNHQTFIEEAISSVLGQDFQNSDREVLVVDDGSTDDTAEIVRRFEPQVRLIRKANGGQASAFNAGIAEARGEVVAFLDGDDWWAPGKLAAVTSVLASEPEVGLVGHGIIEVYPDGRLSVQVPRNLCRFRISSPRKAKLFRLSRGFLGTSRMTFRRDVLRRIGTVPESLKFEADEYLFTLAGFLGEVSILTEPYTFYRLHGKNLYQITPGDIEASQRKQQVIAALALSLRKKLEAERVQSDLALAILECVEVEADVLRLRVESGFPWETVSTELRVMRVFQSDSSFWQRLFTCIRVAPALVMPSRTYYRWKDNLSQLKVYQQFRKNIMPFPIPKHVKRTDIPES